MNWKKIDVSTYIDLDKIKCFKIGEDFIVFADEIKIRDCDTLGEAKEFISKLINFTDIEEKD